MITLKNIDLLNLQTSYMKQDVTTKALCAALNSQFQQLADEVKACMILLRVNELDSAALDELAWQLHVDWYDANADIEVKRHLIKNALKVHLYRGTPYAVEQVVQDYFGDGEVEEWFEYGGEPYTFKVIVDISALKDGLNTFFKALDTVKNTRSHLEEFIGKKEITVQIHTKYKEYPILYNMCGTFLCGTKPCVMNEGISLNTQLNVNANKASTSQRYKLTGTIRSGEVKI